MAQARDQGTEAASERPRRYTFALNPYTNDRFGICPRCKGATAELVTALVFYVAPGLALTMRCPCRHCAACDLLIAHQADVERTIEQENGGVPPDLIGHDFQAIGTMDLADWERSRNKPYTIQQLQACLYPFRQELELIQTRAPSGDVTVPAGNDATKAAGWKKNMSVPTRMRPAYASVTHVTDAFCAEHLTEEYAELCRALAAALCRKRTSLLAQGKLDSWACGIVYTIGSVNFLFDKSQIPHMRARDLCKHFGLSQSTGAARSKAIRDSLKIDFYDAHWCLPSRLDQHPLAWLIEVDGFPVDARHVSRAIQEEAVRCGLIPYAPG
jgi:hypothetical protein